MPMALERRIKMNDILLGKAPFNERELFSRAVFLEVGIVNQEYICPSLLEADFDYVTRSTVKFIVLEEQFVFFIDEAA